MKRQTKKPTVEISAHVRPAPAGTKFIRVGLRSNCFTRVGRFVSIGDVEYTEDSLAAKVAAMAGALAERQNAHYGDKHDPSEIAKHALEAFHELRATPT